MLKAFYLPHLHPLVLPASDEISEQVKAAQQRLLSLRHLNSIELTRSDKLTTASARHDADVTTAVLPLLPSHLGWSSSNLSRTFNVSATPNSPVVEKPDAALCRAKEADESAVSITLYPDLALALLKEKRVAAGRVWLILRQLDCVGRGWLEIAFVKKQLTHSHSHFRVCGWRQLRNLLKNGDNLFWTLSNGRVWLRSVPKVAHQLGISRFKTNPVLLPQNLLLGKISVLRAHLYATFLSGRQGNGTAPISRAAIEAETSISPRIQRLYERTAKVSHQTHYCLGTHYSNTNFEESAWKYGHSIFKLKDVLGKQGTPGREYIAWQLPNSYSGPHKQLSKRLRTRMNKRLVDLLNKGMTGNDQHQNVRPAKMLLQRRYFVNGRHAVKATNRQPMRPIYLRDGQDERMWHVMTP